MQFKAILAALFLSSLAAATPFSAARSNALVARDYYCKCGGAIGSAKCTSGNANGCAQGDCDCCCSDLENSEPTASLPPVGKI